MDTLTKINGIADLARLVQEQPMPSEVEEGGANWEYSQRYVNQSFKPALKCIMQAVRSERAINEFMANKDWLDRLLQIAEEFAEEEVTIAVVRIFKLIFKSDTEFENIC